MSLMNWPAHEITLALAGHGLIAPEMPVFEISNIQTDSRKVQPGELFVCLRGERFDAHDFAEQVVQQGVSGLIVERRLDLDCPQWVVDDTRLALGHLAKAWRAKFDMPVWGVVGSNGKTTTKEMLASVARARFGEKAVCVTQGNLNNEIGVPLTLFRLRSSHKVAVIEMGMNHPGEIDYLAGIVSPNAVILTNAQREHQEFMKTVAAVAEENGSAFCHLRENGCAVFPGGTSFDALWQKQAGDHRTVTFGRKGLVNAASTRTGAVISLNTERQGFAPSFLGEHNYSNAAAVAGLAWAQGIPLATIARGLEAFEPVQGRMKLIKQNERLMLIDDTYNANPDSVNAASDLLASLPGHSMLVLGDMGEVGDQAEKFHREVGGYAKQQGVERMCLIGQHSRHAAQAFGAGAIHFESLELLITYLKEQIEQAQWNVLVKGSRYMKMERVIHALTEGEESLQSGGKHAA